MQNVMKSISAETLEEMVIIAIRLEAQQQEMKQEQRMMMTGLT